MNADDLQSGSGDGRPDCPVRPGPWALDPVKALGKDHRRIEASSPRVPGTSTHPHRPPDILSSLISASTAQYEANGLPEAGRPQSVAVPES